MKIGAGAQHNGVRYALGDFSTDFSKLSSDLSAGEFSQASIDPIMGVPAWAWLAGGVILYMFFFTGGEYSRASRGRRAVRKGISATREAYA